MAQPIEIVIRKTDETAQQTLGQVEGKKKGKTSVKDGAVNTALINAGKQILSYGISQYGNVTGNTIKQRQMNDAINVAGYIATISLGGTVGVIAVATELAINAVSNTIETNKANREAELLYQRSGNATINGGRGTNE